MKPTVLEGDVVWVNKLAYDLKVPFTTLHLAEWANPERGDIVVFFEPIHEQRYVKRIVGLPGDVIELNDNQLTLNGRPVEMKPIGSQMSEGSVRSEEILGGHRHAMALLPGKPAMRSFAPLTVPAGHYFVMGDNRDNSLDSRFIGTIERRRIIGRASGILASADPEHYYRPRLERWCTRLQ